MTNLRDILTDMVKETMTRQKELEINYPNADKQHYQEVVEALVDMYLIIIKKRLIGE